MMMPAVHRFMRHGQRSIPFTIAAVAAASVLLGQQTRTTAYSANHQSTAVPRTAAAPLSRVDPAFLQMLQWRSIGPSRGGRVLAVAGDPGNRLVFYFGATGGGVWKTEDGGLTWRNVSDGFFGTGSVGAIDIAPSDPRVIYVGMGEACFRGDVSHGDGVYKSTDSGRTWTRLGLDATRHIARVRIHPRNPDIVYVAALGDGFGPSPDRGVYRSTDGGRTWEKILSRGNDAGAIDLVMDPGHPDTLYASFLELRRFPWAIRSAGPGTGIFKTTDGGNTWTELTSNSGLPSGPKGRIGLALSPARPDRLWAIIDAGIGKKGVYRTDDGGATWSRVSDNAELTQRPWYYHHIFADPKDPDTIYVLNIQMWKSTDGGRTYAEIRPPHGDNHDLWIDPDDPMRMIEGNDGGGTVSYNGGKSWSTLLNQPTAQMYHVTTDDQFPYRVYGAQQDNSSISLPSRSDFGSITSEEWMTAAAGESGYIAVNQRDPSIIYGADHHWLNRYDLRSHQERDISPNPESHYGWGARDINYRFQWTYPVFLSPHDNRTLYVTSQVVHRSVNEGQSWEVISPDLTRHDPSKLEPTPSYADERIGLYWGPITRDNTGVEWYSTIFAFAESPLVKGLLWTGSDDGYVQVSKDAGRNWTNVTPKDLPDFSQISIIEPSPHDPATAFVAAMRYKLQDRQPYLYKTTDYGRTWTKITSGIPDGDFTRVIREDPGRPGLLYAGTETGVYVSFDSGGHWASLRLNLPVVPVHDLAVKHGDLIAATHGRSFWILDNVALLHQLENAAVADRVHLFTPRTTVRFRANASLAAALDGFDAAGRNPPGGVVVSYFLKDPPAGEVTLTFSDVKGREIHRFSSPAVTSNGESTTSGRPALTFRAVQGPNRFVWDTRYPGANVIPGTTLHGSTAGPLAAPGTYRVALSAGGQTLTQTFQLVKDPRVTYTDQQLVDQFNFLVAVRDKLTETHDVVRRIRRMREQAEAEVQHADGTPAASDKRDALKRLNDKLYAIEERLSQYRAKATQDLTNYPVGIDDKLVVLFGFAAKSDAPPTASSIELQGRLSKRLQESVEALKDVERTEWTAFSTGAPK